jgi:hypothetical protein
MSKARDLANAGTALTTVSATELGYLDGVTSAVQTQVDAKIAKSTATTKGDILVATGSGTIVRQGVGTDGQYLKADSAQADGVIWADVTTLPSQTSQSGKFLTTDGTTASWGIAAKATEIFDLTTSREWLNTTFRSAGNYSIVTSAGTATVYVYNSSNELTHEFAITTTASINTISAAFARMEAVGSTSLNLSITPASSVTTSTGGTLSLDTITGSGNYGAGSGNAAGGTSGYVAGQLAHVIVVGGSGGSGGGGGGGNNYTSGAGGTGGVVATSTPITLTGTYSLTVGAAGNGGNGGDPGQAGNAGGATSGFGFTGNGGGGGTAARSSPPRVDGANGTPAVPPISSQIFSPATAAKLGVFAGTSITGSFNIPGNGGNAGRIFVLRWTP